MFKAKLRRATKTRNKFLNIAEKRVRSDAVTHVQTCLSTNVAGCVNTDCHLPWGREKTLHVQILSQKVELISTAT